MSNDSPLKNMSPVGYLSFCGENASPDVCQKLDVRAKKLSRQHGEDISEKLYSVSVLDQAWEELLDEGEVERYPSEQ